MSHSKEIGTVHPYEIDDLTHYIFHTYSGLMTLAEKLAYKNLMVERKTDDSSSENMKRHLRRHFQSTEPEVVALLDKGAREFLIATRNRLLRDQSKEFSSITAPNAELSPAPQKHAFAPSAVTLGMKKERADKFLCGRCLISFLLGFSASTALFVLVILPSERHDKFDYVRFHGGISARLDIVSRLPEALGADLER